MQPAAERRRLQRKLAGFAATRFDSTLQIFRGSCTGGSVEGDDFGVGLASQLARLTISNAPHHRDGP